MGPPGDTCLKHFKEELAVASKPFAVTSIITGVVFMILVFAHVGLYFRPDEKIEQPYVDNRAAQGHQPELVANVSTT